MAKKALKNLISLQDLKSDRITNFKKETVYMRYNDVVDSFYLMIVPPTQETVVFYLDEHIGLLFSPGNREIVGFQVEAFQTVFLEKHEDLKKSIASQRSTNVLKEMTTKKMAILRQVVTASEPSFKRGNFVLPERFKNVPSSSIVYA